MLQHAKNVLPFLSFRIWSLVSLPGVLLRGHSSTMVFSIMEAVINWSFCWACRITILKTCPVLFLFLYLFFLILVLIYFWAQESKVKWEVRQNGTGGLDWSICLCFTCQLMNSRLLENNSGTVYFRTQFSPTWCHLRSKPDIVVEGDVYRAPLSLSNCSKQDGMEHCTSGIPVRREIWFIWSEKFLFAYLALS